MANVFVLGQRFDFATLDSADLINTRGSLAELSRPVSEQTIGNLLQYTKTGLLYEAAAHFLVYVVFPRDGNVLGSINRSGLLHLWRAPSWEEIEEAEKRTQEKSL